MISVGDTVRFSLLSTPLGEVVAVNGDWVLVLLPNGLGWSIVSSELRVIHG